jgi:hypothetical protein
MESTNQRNCIEFRFSSRKLKFRTTRWNPILEKQKGELKTYWWTTIKWRFKKNSQILREELEQWCKRIRLISGTHKKQIVISIKQPNIFRSFIQAMWVIVEFGAKANPWFVALSFEKNSYDISSQQILQFLLKNLRTVV